MFPARQPASAGMTSVLLNGQDHYEEDREAAGRIIEVLPEAPAMIRASHRWQSCAVRLMAHRGIRQYLDLGAGYLVTGTADDELMPVHEAAWGAGITTAHVVYADSDGEAADAAWLMTGQAPGTGAVCADMRDVGAVLGGDAGRRLIDPGRPVGIMFGLSLHFMSPDEARETVAAWAGAVAPESLIAVTVARFADPELWERVRVAHPGPLWNFSAAETAGLFSGMVVLPPGVGAVEWGRAGRVQGRAFVAGGIGLRR